MKLLKLKNLIISQKYNIIFVIIDKFIKWGYFIIYIEKILIKDMAQIYIKKVFAKHGVLNKIILDKNIKFIVVF